MKSKVNLLKVIMTFVLFILAGYGAYAQATGGSATVVATINSNTHQLATGLSVTGQSHYVQTAKAEMKSVAVTDTEWTQFYGNGGKNECYAAQQTSDGGYIMLGRSNSVGAGDFDAWLIKTDAQGEVVWSKTYGDSYIDEAYMVKELTEGGYIIAGMTTSFGWAGEGWLIKTDPDGNVIWSKGYHPSVGSTQSAWDYFYDVVENADGSFVVVGNAPDVDFSTQGWILKVNSEGDYLWDHEFGDIYWERLFSLQLTTDGGYIAAGDAHVTYNDTVFKHDGWLVKFDANGDTTWSKTFGSVEHDLLRCVKQTSDGGYIATGERQVTEPTGFQGWVLKTDANGNEVWSKTFSKGGLYGVQETPYGNFLASGTIITSESGCDGWLIETDPGGNVLWENTLTGSPLDDMFLSLNKTSDGGYILGGKYNHVMEAGDYWLVKVEPEGPTPVSYFFQDFDEVTPPALPLNWAGLVDVMLSNTAAEVKTLEQGSTTSAPNSTFIMNGIDGSNGQLDPSAFVALITPYVIVGDSGSILTFWASGGNAIQVGTMSDPLDPATFVLTQEVPLTYEFAEYSVIFTTPCNTWIALKHANTNSVTPLFVDDALYQQLNAVSFQEKTGNCLAVFPNPASSMVTIESEEPISAIQVIDVIGRTIYSEKESFSLSVSLNTASFSAGNYIIRAICKNGMVITRKLIIAR